tara:strand:- start:86 stop:445 length:360 start_codon:yes stop_codon:yes gene_type:complete
MTYLREHVENRLKMAELIGPFLRFLVVGSAYGGEDLHQTLHSNKTTRSLGERLSEDCSVGPHETRTPQAGDTERNESRRDSREHDRGPTCDWESFENERLPFAGLSVQFEDEFGSLEEF